MGKLISKVFCYYNHHYRPILISYCAYIIILSMFILFIHCSYIFNHRPSSRTIKIKYGTLRGVVINFSEKNLPPVEVFLGIPYASPPIRKLRFMPPVTPAIWSGVKNANSFGPVCPQKLPKLENETLALRQMTEGRLKIIKKLKQMLSNQNEDCLYLNIYVPYGVTKETARFPVLVFIHGESYDWNAGSAYDGSILASQSQILVITINFRLGVLGFFPSLGGSARGNFGLMDQVAALHWIQENIKEFNGDERNVTIIGYGHGAACVNFLMLSPMAKGLFHRAIMISGSALSPWAIASDAIFHAKNFAKSLDCFENSNMPKDALDCLRDKTVKELLSVDLKIPAHLTAFGPVIDGIVIPNNPALLMSKPNSIFSRYELLFGLTKSESYNLFSMYDERHGIELSRRDRLLRTLIRNLFNDNLQEIFLTVVNEYTDWKRPFLHPISLFDSLVNIFSDALVVTPTIKTGLLHSKQSGSKTYFFIFAHQTENGDYPTRMGCIHSQDMAYLFGAPLVNGVQFSWFSKNYSKLEILLSKNYIHYLSNFIKTGSPNNETVEKNFKNSKKLQNNEDYLFWPEYEENEQRYILFDTEITTNDHYQAHRLSYWANLLPQLHQPGISKTKQQQLPESHNIETYDDGIVRYGSLSAPVSFNTYFNVDNINQNSTKTHLLNNQTVNIIPNYESKDNENGSIIGQSFLAKNSFLPSTNNSFSMIVQSNNLYTWLSLIIAIGCSLLILNVLVFAGFYYHKDRNRLETKLLRQKQQHQQPKQLTLKKHKTENNSNRIPLYKINSITQDYNKQNS